MHAKFCAHKVSQDRILIIYAGGGGRGAMMIFQQVFFFFGGGGGSLWKISPKVEQGMTGVG